MSMLPGRSIALKMISAAVAAGLVLGVSGRLLMRLIAIEAGGARGYSFGGSLEVIAFGVLLGSPVAVIFWLVRSRVPLPAPRAGVSLGIAMTIVLTLFPPPAARSALASTDDAPLTTLLGFLVVFTAWGAVIDLVTRWVDRR